MIEVMSDEHNLEANTTLIAYEVINYITTSNIDSINDILLNLLIKTIEVKNGYLSNPENFESIINKGPNDNFDQRLSDSLKRYDFIDNYHKYILTEECILDKDGNLKVPAVKDNKVKSQCLSIIKQWAQSLDLELKTVSTTNSEEYHLVYLNIANQFPTFNDKKINDIIDSWGNLKKSYHLIKTKEPGMNLSLKLTTQSEFNKNEIFFIKAISDIFSKPKESSVYSIKDGNLTKVDLLSSESDIFLIGLYKLYYNMELIDRATTYKKFVHLLKHEELSLGLLKRFDYMIDEIQSAYNINYDYYKENDMPAPDPNDNTYVEEIQRLNQHEIKKLLDILIQQKWVILYPNSSLKASSKLHYEMNTYQTNKCFKCPNSINIEQGLQCGSCQEGFLCLSCSKGYLDASKHTMNKKDRSLNDGKWCPKCFEPWRSPEDMIFYL